MAIRTTPHTQTQQNVEPFQDDLEPNQFAADSGQDEDASLYENMDGAQTGGTRAFNANEMGGPQRNTEPRTAAVNGGIGTRTPEGDNRGITNHSISEESARQRKVVNERPHALAGVDQVGHQVR